MRDYSKTLLRHTGTILWGPIERFITIVGGLVGILVVFNRPLTDWLVSTHQGIPWWIGLLILGGLFLQAVFRAGYDVWKEEKQARTKAEAALRQTQEEREELKSQNEALTAENEELLAQADSHPQSLPADVASSNYIANRSFSITDLTRNDDRIVGKTFENCTIWGPAALAPDGLGVIDGCTFDGPRESVVWSVGENQQRAIGVIGLEDCVFRRCYFRRIGIVGGLALREKFERDEAKRNKESGDK